MKAINYIQKIVGTNQCSIATAQNLSKAMVRENRLHSDLVLKFSPLYRNFSFVEKEWFEADITPLGDGYYFSESFNDIEKVFYMAEKANEEYKEFKERV